MKDPHLLHIVTPSRNVSPFDVEMAYEAEYDGVIPYANVTIDDISSLVRDIIFSRRRKSLQRSALFIGGRDPGLALDMMYRARGAMINSSAVSIFTDPEGAFTTSAAVVASLERIIKLRTQRKLAGLHITVLGGTDSVGVCCGVLAARLGGLVTLLSSGEQVSAEQVAEEYNQRCEVKMMGSDIGIRVRMYDVLGQSEIIIAASRSGRQLLDEEELRMAPLLQAVADLNPVAPFGIGGLRAGDFGVRMEATRSGTLGVGAHAIGAIKFQVHRRIFEIIKKSKDPLSVGMEYIMEIARDYVPHEPTTEEEQDDI